MTEYTRELSKDILERLQTQRVVGNQTGASQADVSITEALTLLAEIERLQEENARLERINTDMSWTISPDRMGMF